MTRPVRLYGMNSPNVRKVGILLAELGIGHELVPVDVFGGGQFAPAFRAMSPFAKVPVLDDPSLGQPIAESGAILIALAERHRRFLPAAGDDRHEVLQWLAAQLSLGGPMLGQLNHFRLLPPGVEPYAEGRYAAQAETVYGTVEARLAGRDWLAGDACSIADIAWFPWMDYLERHGFDPAAYPALTAWRSRIAARPAVVDTDARFAAFTAASTDSRRRASDADLDRFFGRTARVPAADYSAVRA